MTIALAAKPPATVAAASSAVFERSQRPRVIPCVQAKPVRAVLELAGEERRADEQAGQRGEHG